MEKQNRTQIFTNVPSSREYYLSPEHKQSSAHDNEGWHEDFDYQTARDDAVSNIPRRFPDHIPIDRLHTQTRNNSYNLNVIIQE